MNNAWVRMSYNMSRHLAQQVAYKNEPIKETTISHFDYFLGKAQIEHINTSSRKGTTGNTQETKMIK